MIDLVLIEFFLTPFDIFLLYSTKFFPMIEIRYEVLIGEREGEDPTWGFCMNTCLQFQLCSFMSVSAI